MKELSLTDLDDLFEETTAVPTGKDELTLADIDSLLLEEQSTTYKKHVKWFTHLPNPVDGKYVKVNLDDPKYPCTFPHCKLTTHLTVEDIPYCSRHISYPMSMILERLDRKIMQLEGTLDEDQ